LHAYWQAALTQVPVLFAGALVTQLAQLGPQAVAVSAAHAPPAH